MATNTEPSFRNNKMFRGGKDEMVDSMVKTLVENVRTTYCNLIYLIAKIRQWSSMKSPKQCFLICTAQKMKKSFKENFIFMQCYVALK